MNTGDTLRYIMIKETFNLLGVSMAADPCQKTMEAWNALPQPRYGQKESFQKLKDVHNSLREKGMAPEPIFATAVLFAVEKNSPEAFDFLAANRDHYMECNVLEFCREIVLRMKHLRQANLSNWGKEYGELIKEDKNTHVADILGLILDELQEKGGMTDSLCEELTGELKEYILQWRELDLPKTEAAEAYPVMKEVEEICFKHQAYRTCLILAPMYLISGKDCHEHFDESLFFIGKVLYELGYPEHARNCFQRVDANTGQACWSGEGGEKYRRLLKEETKLEVPQCVHDRDEAMQEKVRKGEALIVSSEEYSALTPPYEEMVKMERQKNSLLKKKIAAVSEQWEEFDLSGGGALHDKAEELSEILGESGKDTEEAALIRRRNGEEYLKEQDYKRAEEEFHKAYSLRMGRYDGKLMSDLAALAEHKGQKGQMEAYRFRAGLLPAAAVKAVVKKSKSASTAGKKTSATVSKKEKKKTHHLPGNFSYIMKRGDMEEMKAVFQDKETVQELIRTGESPLFYYSPCTEIYKWFVEQGFDIRLDTWRGQPIHYHAEAGTNNIEGIILAGGDIEAVRSHGLTPLLLAAKALNPSALRVLIRYGADVRAKAGRMMDEMGSMELVFQMWKPDEAVRATECMELLLHAGIEAEDWMKDEVIAFCKDYERSKDSIHTDDLQPYEEAMTRMCELFDVERPIPNVHDGAALITVTSADWKDQHEELWDMLVPGAGKCKTVQGEVIRIGGRIQDEIFRNAGGNWNREYRNMLNALKKYYVKGEIPDEKEHQEALALIKSIGRDSDGADVLRLCEINVRWVLANPRPILLEA